MAIATPYPNAPDVSADDYLVVGLATCFLKQDGEVQEVHVLEPIPSAALEAIFKGIPTSYQFAQAVTLGSVLAGEIPQIPPEFPESAQLCDEFDQRAIASVRTYKSRTAAQSLIPLGTTRSDFNYSTDRKRVLNIARVVRKEDNVKQHSHTHKVL